MSIDLTLLPPPAVLEYPEFEAILAQQKAQLIANCPESTRPAIAAALELESEPLLINLQQASYNELLIRERINSAIKATFLATAAGADLEHFAAGRGLTRKIIQAANPNIEPPVPEILESDAALRHRCQLFPEKLAAAGPREAYYAHALDASNDVADAQIINADSGLVPAGTVRVYVKSYTEENAPPLLLTAVYNYLSAETRRPLCDTVEVMAAVPKNIEIQWTNEYESGPDKAVVYSIQSLAIKALVDKNQGIFASVALSKIIGALDVEGVKKVTLAAPLTDVVCGIGEYPVFTLKAPPL